MGNTTDIRHARSFRSIKDLLYSGLWHVAQNRAHHEEPYRYDHPELERSPYVAKHYYQRELSEREMHEVSTHLRVMGLNEQHFFFSANRHWLIMDQVAFSREIEPNMTMRHQYR